MKKGNLTINATKTSGNNGFIEITADSVSQRTDVSINVSANSISKQINVVTFAPSTPTPQPQEAWVQFNDNDSGIFDDGESLEFVFDIMERGSQFDDSDYFEIEFEYNGNTYNANGNIFNDQIHLVNNSLSINQTISVNVTRFSTSTRYDNIKGPNGTSILGTYTLQKK